MKSSNIPIPPFITREWFHTVGVHDPEGLVEALRPESVVMAPENLRAVKATRLSFAKSLVLRMARQRWQIALKVSEIDKNGKGTLVYEIRAEGAVFHFAVASQANSGIEKAGRFCESEYDFFGAILDGEIDLDAVREELAEITSKVWSGRTSNHSFGWTVANRSNRFFDHVVDRLVRKQQPDDDFLKTGGGYIIRNAGWYGNGRHGSRAWLAIGKDHPLGYPYHLDLFALYMWRIVGFDVAEATARAKDATAVAIDVGAKRSMGIGNSSGIGMVAALVRWPAWLSGFNFLRELSLAYAITRAAPISSVKVEILIASLEASAKYYAGQPACPVKEIEQPDVLAQQLSLLAAHVRNYALTGRINGSVPLYPWQRIAEIANSSGREASEQFNAALIEMESEFSDEVAKLLPAALSIQRKILPSMRIRELKELLSTRYHWALNLDLEAYGARKYFWYRSEENGENRRGERDLDAGAEHETFVDVAGAIQELNEAIRSLSQDSTVAELALMRPDLAHVISRAQLAKTLPYSEIRANILDQNFLPMDGIRFLLSTMGLESSHPHNTRWVRGVFLQDSLLPADFERYNQTSIEQLLKDTAKPKINNLEEGV